MGLELEKGVLEVNADVWNYGIVGGGVDSIIIIVVNA